MHECKAHNVSLYLDVKVSATFGPKPQIGHQQLRSEPKIERYLLQKQRSSYEKTK